MRRTAILVATAVGAIVGPHAILGQGAHDGASRAPAAAILVPPGQVPLLSPGEPNMRTGASAAWTGSLDLTSPRMRSSPWDNVPTVADSTSVDVDVMKLGFWTAAGTFVGDIAGLYLVFACSDTGGDYCSTSWDVLKIALPVAGGAAGALIGESSLLGATAGSAVGILAGVGVVAATENFFGGWAAHALVTTVVAAVVD